LVRGVGCPYAGQVRFGFAGKGLWSELDRLRAGPSRKGVVPIEPVLRASIKFFGRDKGGFIRDGVLLTLGQSINAAQKRTANRRS
jgi:hypothetical protein